MSVRFKGRDYHVVTYEVRDPNTMERRHEIQIVASYTGRNVRIYLDGKQLVPS